MNLFQTALVAGGSLALISAASAAVITAPDDFNIRGGSATVVDNAGRIDITRPTTGFTNIDIYPGAAANGATGFNPASATYSLSGEEVFTFEDAQQILVDGDGTPVLALRVFYYDAADTFLSELLVFGDQPIAPGTDIVFNAATGVDNVDGTALTVPATAANYNILLSIVTGPADPNEGYSFASISATPVPEPTSLAAIGALGALGLRRRRSA
ncbi:MAG: PEP-CTERM sorting domain-containing protein [Planctomycetota bacterium]